MSWCSLTSGDERSAIKIEGYARNDDSAKRYQNSAALHYYLRRTNPFEPANLYTERRIITSWNGSQYLKNVLL